MNVPWVGRTAAAFVLSCVLASPVLAQGSYVGAFLVGDVVRLDRYDSRDVDSGSGETLGFALRLGTPVASRWGVEVEFVRPGEITSEQSPDVFPLAESSLPLRASSLPGLPVNAIGYDPLLLPRYSYTFRSTERRTTIATSLWVRQEITPRFSLAYVGGVAFGRTDRELEVTYQPVFPVLPVVPGFPISLPAIAPTVSESVDYSVGPMVGVEGRIRMAGTVDLVPSLRLHGIDGGWMIRPAVGLSWNF